MIFYFTGIMVYMSQAFQEFQWAVGNLCRAKFEFKSSWSLVIIIYYSKWRKRCWSNFVFHNFQGDSRFLNKIPGYFQGSRSQNKFQAFQGFQWAVGTLWRAKFEFKSLVIIIYYSKWQNVLLARKQIFELISISNTFIHRSCSKNKI